MCVGFSVMEFLFNFVFKSSPKEVLSEHVGQKKFGGKRGHMYAKKPAVLAGRCHTEWERQLYLKIEGQMRVA